MNSPKGTWFKFNDEVETDPILFDHLDGMYSVCWYHDQIVHVNATAEVVIVEKPQ